MDRLKILYRAVSVDINLLILSGLAKKSLPIGFYSFLQAILVTESPNLVLPHWFDDPRE